jgi:hypothetical protein
VKTRRRPIFVPSVILGLEVALLLLRPEVSYAVDTQLTGSRYLSTRAAAMGNNFLGIGDDTAYALFSDPSILGTYNQFQYELLNFSLYGGSIALDILNVSFPAKFTNLQSQKDRLAENYLAYVASGQQVFTGFMYKHFAMGLLVKGEYAAEDYGTGLLYYRGNYQFIPTIGYGFSFYRGKLHVGYSLQWVNEMRGQNEISSTSTTAAFNDGLYQGSGFSQTLAFSYKPKKSKTAPEYNLVIRNLLGLQFSSTSLVSFGTNNSGPPPSESMMVDGSMHGQFELSKQFGLTYVLQATDLTGQYESPWQGRFGLGLELTIKNYYGRGLYQLRAGLGNGYPAIGLGIVGRHIQFDASWYTQDVGTFYHEYGDQRILLQVRFRVGKPPELDPERK